MQKSSLPAAVAALFVVCLSPMAARAEAPNAAMIEALRPFDGLVGQWQGTGTSQTSSGWNESIECSWGFRDRDGRVSLNFFAKDSLLIDKGLLTFDPEDKKYRFIVQSPKGGILRFQGDITGERILVMDRADADAKDKLDRVELKMVREGKKMIYTFKRKVGTSFYETNGNVELFRESPDLAEFEGNPKCVVTGGLGRVEGEYNGEKYFFSCPATKELFETDPQAFLTK